MDIKDAADEYLASLLRLRPKSRIGYTQRLGVFVSWCHVAQITLEGIRPKTIDLFVTHLASSHHSHHAGSPLSGDTLAGYIRVVKAFLNWCSQDDEYGDYVKPILPRRIKVPKTGGNVIETLSDAQVAALREAAKRNYNEMLKLRDEVIITVLFTTGIRASELCGLTLGNTHLSPDESYIKVLGKGQKERLLPLDTPTRRLLHKYIHQERQFAASPGFPLFVTRAGKEALTVAGLEDVLHRLAAFAGLSGVNVRPHVFRHTFARNFMLANGNIFLLQKLLGHEHISTTEGYLRKFGSLDVLALYRKSEGTQV